MQNQLLPVVTSLARLDTSQCRGCARSLKKLPVQRLHSLALKKVELRVVRQFVDPQEGHLVA